MFLWPNINTRSFFGSKEVSFIQQKIFLGVTSRYYFLFLIPTIIKSKIHLVVFHIYFKHTSLSYRKNVVE